eukprot:Rhum_TRINITY_DN12777_c0_g2::Rhum_TRINITY_DN12777_c0_g2_i1::g.54272::m.54272/K11253/H3; histone H3
MTAGPSVSNPLSGLQWAAPPPQQNTGGSTPQSGGFGGFGAPPGTQPSAPGFGAFSAAPKVSNMAKKVPKKTPKKTAPVPKKKAPAMKKKAMKASAAPEKKAHRWKPGTVAKREILRLQKSNDSLLAFAPFRRILSKIAEDEMRRSDIRVPSTTARAVADAAEAFMVETFNAALLIAKNGKSSTVTSKDLRTALLVRGQEDMIEESGKNHIRQLLDRK